ncbi:MAG: hypothetical protein K8I03_01000 [Ignavibacteria bacterium]|nr:hypothetical protein [Ignavibacteria bacterium]
MPFSTISIIELVIIAILLVVIVEYEIERRNMKKEIHLVYRDMGFRISAHIERTLKHANAVRHKLSNELYLNSPRKNDVIKEVCNAFYEQLSNKLK